MAQEKLRILVVDDDKGITESLSMLLESEGYQTDVAHTIKEAIEKSYENYYNLAILDIRLPDGEGTSLLKALRETSPKTMKIMLTGYPILENAVDSLNDGAVAYLIKPVDIEKLLETIKDKIEAQKIAETATEDSIAVFLHARSKKLLTGN
ncbi:MAG: response regulator [Candidatus Bathyarchaeia archaeon]|jgi:two-component system response regulator PilR (NtrC family)